MWLYLGFDNRDKKNKTLQDATKNFICDNFTIECVEIGTPETLHDIETEWIRRLKSCLNNKKIDK
jgi:hypothetical protein